MWDIIDPIIKVSKSSSSSCDITSKSLLWQTTPDNVKYEKTLISQCVCQEIILHSFSMPWLINDFFYIVFSFSLSWSALVFCAACVTLNEIKLGQLMSLIVKRHVLNNKQRIMFNCEPAMINEINAYSKVLPILKKFTCRDDQLPFANMFFAGSDEKGWWYINYTILITILIYLNMF